MQPDLIDRIYECSFAPELWPGVLSEMAGMSEARGGLLFIVNNRRINYTATENLGDVFRSYVEDGWFAKCNRGTCLMSQSDPRFFVEYDFWSPPELDETAIYRDFFRPRGLGWSASTALRAPTEDNIILTVERDLGRGPIEGAFVQRLDGLRPHLARASLMSARLGLKRAQGTKEAFARMGLPAFLLDEGGVVLEASDQASEAEPHIVWRGNGGIAFADPRATAQLGEAMAALDSDPEKASCSFPVRDADDRAVLVAHLVPVQRSATDVFGASFAVLVLTPVSAQRVPSAALLRSLFDLTTAEARVARGLALGSTLDEIATSGEVAITTVRSQLARVLEKTGCARQAEVVALMANVELGAKAN